MSESPITKTLEEMLGKLKDAIEARAEAEKQVTEYSNAIKALAKVIEDQETGARYLVMLDEITGKPGFLDAIRYVLKGHPEGFTPVEIRTRIQFGKKMDLSAYSNPMASIHTTLRRMAESSEVELVTNAKGEKAYRLVRHGGMERPPEPPRRIRRML